jgi:hypothetical protein
MHAGLRDLRRFWSPYDFLASLANLPLFQVKISLAKIFGKWLFVEVKCGELAQYSPTEA